MGAELDPSKAWEWNDAAKVFGFKWTFNVIVLKVYNQCNVSERRVCLCVRNYRSDLVVEISYLEQTVCKYQQKRWAPISALSCMLCCWNQGSRCQFHQHFTCASFVRKQIAQLSLLTFQLWNFWRQHFVQKNLCITH